MPSTGPDEGLISLALATIKQGATVSETAKTYGIARQTLQYRIAGGVPRSKANAEKQYLSKDAEKIFKDWYTTMLSMALPITRATALVMAGTLKRQANPAAFDPSYSWFDAFAKRQTMVKATATSLETDRTLAVTPERIQDHCTRFADTIQKYRIRRKNCYNVDE